MSEARVGDRVRVHYTGRLEDGTVFATSEEEGGEPLEFTLGSGAVVPGLEDAIEGMREGERKSVWLPPALAYGAYREDEMLLVERRRLPAHILPEVGQKLQMKRQGRPAAIVTVSQVSEQSVVLDTNHPLAGREITYDVELLEIR